MRHRRHGFAPIEIALGPRTCVVVPIPVEARRETEPLSGLQTECVDIRDEDDWRDDGLTSAGRFAEFEFRRLLDAIGQIETRISESYDLGFGSLGLQQEAAEIRRIDGVAYTSDDLSSRLLDRDAGVGFQ